MSAARFLRPVRRRAATLVLFLCPLTLVACVGKTGTEAALESIETAGVPAAISQDLVPAPTIFEATGTARWDGRRTLQGIWVAHPQASTRRVRIYNAATGAAADGALFARQAALSGPSMLVSSDAARLLGMTPGEETGLRVVALTARAQASDVPASVQAPAEAPTYAAEAEIDAVQPARTPALAPTGVTEARVSARRPMAASPVVAPADASSAAALEAAAPSVSAAARAPGTRTASPPAAPAALSVDPGVDAAPAPAKASDAAAALDAAPAIAPATPPAAVTAGRPKTPSDSASASSDTPPAGSSSARPTLAQPYVQAGLFAVPENAIRLIGRIEAAGIPAIGAPVRLADGPATRVLAGPFTSVAERDAARRRIRDMGLRDAIPVVR